MIETQIANSLWKTPDATGLETQVLPGERVRVLENDGQWRYVELLDQPQFTSSWHGYRGWMCGDPSDGKLEFEAKEGIPYLLGGMTQDAIDCSGLVHLIYRQAGLRVPRNAHDQYLACGEGDRLLFMAKKDNPEKIVHVMIHVDDDLYFEATAACGHTRMVKLEDRLREPDECWVTYQGSFCPEKLTAITSSC